MIDQFAVTAFAGVAIISAFTGIVRWSQRQLGGASSASLQPLPFSAALWQKRLSLMWVNGNGSSLAWSMVVWLIQSYFGSSHGETLRLLTFLSLFFKQRFMHRDCNM